MMKRVVNTWVESQVFVYFDEIIDAAFAAYPDEPSFVGEVTASPCVEVGREFLFFQPAPPLYLLNLEKAVEAYYEGLSH